MHSYRYRLVDVFTDTPFTGNGLVVFPDATGLDTATMQKIAREMNQSESAFVFPHERRGDAMRVRIFTPAYEMAFAGHPTIGTAYVMRDETLVPRDADRLLLWENVGDVPVRVDAHGMLWLTTPPIATQGELARDACARAVSLDERDLIPDLPCTLASAGNPTLYVPVADAASVDRAEVDGARFYELIRGRTEPLCVFVFAPTPNGAYARMFGPEHGIVEDPATGSSTGPLAAYMMAHGLAPHHDGARFVSEQGTKMGRRSLLHVHVRGERGCDGIEIGGAVTPIAEATLRF